MESPSAGRAQDRAGGSAGEERLYFPDGNWGWKAGSRRV